jgi:RNA polymerase sigma factor (sigma-70 family)
MPVTVEGRATTRDFDAVVGPWIEPGFRLAVTILADPDEARDAVQEAAVKAWRSLDRLRDPAQARAWFLSIVANQCRSIMRRRWWALRSSSPPNQLGVRMREDDVVRSMDVERGMSRLSAGDRAILHLHFFLDLPLDEVGRVLGISAGAAKSRVYRAARRLRPELTEEDLA